MSTSLARAWLCGLALGFPALASAGCGGEGQSARESTASAAELDEMAALGYLDRDLEPSNARAAGVTRWERGRTAPGRNLWTDDRSRVYLTEVSGELVQSWEVPGGQACELAVLAPEGGVAVVDANERLVRLDADSQILWELDLPVHHELVALADGGWLAPFWHVREYRGRRVRFDGLVWVSADGLVTRGWWSFDLLAELQALHPPLVLDEVTPPSEDAPDTQVYDYYHLNSVQVLPATQLGARDERFRAGNLLLCLRNADLLLVLEPEELRVVWHARPEGMDFAHTPRVLEGGRLLMFDNGAHRDWSRAWELSLPELETVWEYRGSEREPFWSEFRGSAQRLANGNTLLCEADRGRAFEVTRAGEIVWEYWNAPEADASRRRIYRMLRVE